MNDTTLQMSNKIIFSKILFFMVVRTDFFNLLTQIGNNMNIIDYIKLFDFVNTTK